MKIEVGEYVRTKYGITQYKEYETTNGNKLLCMPIKDGSNGIFVNVEDIIKSSPNIIDLIEVGDYVNGKEIHEIDENRKILYSYEKDDYNTILNREIQRVVTKQQFSNMEYKV